MNINYHVHTPLCNHASGSMETYVQTAISMGLSEICFLDHLTLNSAGKGPNMVLAEVPLYFFAAQALKDQYKENITIKVGLEVDYTPSIGEQIQDTLSRFSFDVIGSAVHFLGDQNIVSHNSDWHDGVGNPDEIYLQYYDTLMDMLDEDYFDVVCHLDLIKKFLRKPQQSFADKIKEVLLKIKATHRVVEVNTSGYDHPIAEPYPSESILQQCRALDIPITLGSDAHRPNQLMRYYDKAKEVISAVGYDQLTVFTRRTQQLRPI
jgi:histidinol-phosphatase (PHP family)